MSLEEDNHGQSMPNLYKIASYVNNLGVNRYDNFDKIFIVNKKM